MPKPNAKTAAASGAAAKQRPSSQTTSTVKKQPEFPLTTTRDVEQGTYTAERAEALRAGNLAAVA